MTKRKKHTVMRDGTVGHCAGTEPPLPFISAGYIGCQPAVEEVDIAPRQIHSHLFIASHYRDAESRFANWLLF